MDRGIAEFPDGNAQAGEGLDDEPERLTAADPGERAEVGERLVELGEDARPVGRAGGSESAKKA